MRKLVVNLIFMLFGGLMGIIITLEYWYISTNYGNDMAYPIVLFLQIPKLIIFGLPVLIPTYLTLKHYVELSTRWDSIIQRWTPFSMGCLWCPLIYLMNQGYTYWLGTYNSILIKISLVILPSLMSGFVVLICLFILRKFIGLKLRR